MDDPSSRSLRLLALLQTGRAWSAGELAERLGVAHRTVRRDVARLRSLGYDIRSAPGPGGAYRLAPGVRIPPLLLGADEVCALVTGLLVLETGSADATASTVRAKLERLLTPDLRRRAAATAMTTEVLAPTAPRADWSLLGAVAEAIGAGRHLHFTYTDRRGAVSARRVEPHRHILRHGIWYLIAYDTGREDWRVFRLDRIRDAAPHPAPSGWEGHEVPYDAIDTWFTTDFGRLGDGGPSEPARSPYRPAP